MSQSAVSFQISPVSKTQDPLIQQKIDLKTKPPGALGQLESLALQIARVQATDSQQTDQPQNTVLKIVHPTMLVFAGDHGIAAEGVSIAPSEVTRQMVQNFAHGGAAINVFCRQVGFTLEVIDCGILTPVEGVEGIIDQRLGAGTGAIHLEPAMALETVDKGFAMARDLIERHHQAGCNLVAFGEMGIGNTSAAAAIMAAIMQLDVIDCVGRGTGINSETLERKLMLIELALLLHQSALTGPKSVLACLGGFEIVQMTGAMLAAAERKMLVVVDGFIATAAALVAVQIAPNVRDYLIFAHQSDEQGHQRMLEFLQAKPLLSLGLRLGEGTGAALALPLIQASVNFYNQMASFSDAGIEAVV
ncbi:nicotinate-nucleotide--dimethylbenzimidazole phosphoribosyltransferase [Shewanella sp. N2AIL]|jgi:nicotinate-nucleotide--dimethylbenzimidazole phosphoribosyltransferase|uniref:Nicotinate-nucleotide--dimethylbenzimidazole phosphoribosyltransferase n=1 Tax=Shewanella baltica (strain OS223) TaxID=407976 RepID=COBT_SHEB2|nr:MULTISPECIES: nicotinate-nucleotide--dimethylbenzimidazole phosphoribosyltransferase [Shewanella]B8E4M8.1 RecName: Full=Nicotinate-nucleotide--dimethylbenzimidazole phosphoribosyltransferase; Short=NN:DBI PRT; AltName: Full=N(1)-alpha-phosphoribosyltransferase [Shewanella baltica OS223]ACK45514.1 nicotinate-nucleotide/dimethylbenzimidazole phosphoribosyltransferase [Shewanella baltica OS223]MCI2965183.1 nicotinate-nucleotide--dimethylbenzimidazole phosphoribosyltransferase [Shewanella sp. N2A